MMTEDVLFDCVAALVRAHRELRTRGKLSEAARLQVPTQAIMDLAVDLSMTAQAEPARKLARLAAKGRE